MILMNRNNQQYNLFLLLLLGMCWGPSFLFIKVALEDMGPITLVAVRISLAAIFLYAILKFRGVSLRPYFKLYKELFFMGIISAALPFSLISSGELYISSALASILNSTTPIFATLLAAYFINDEGMTGAKFWGVVLGVLGVVVVFLPAALDSREGNAFGIMLVLIAAAAYAVGMIFSKKKLMGLPALVAPCLQLSFAAAVWVPLALAMEQPHLQEVPSLRAHLAVLALALLGTAAAFAIYFKLIRDAGATFVSTGTLLFPVIGIALGYGFLGERLQTNSIIGTLMILSGLAIFNGLIPKLKKQ